MSVPTTKDVAARAGVSFTTVSHVINNTRPVAPETRARVEAAIKELDYRPNVLARALRKGETKTMGVISISNADPYFSGVLHAIQQVSWTAGFGVYTSFTDPCTACLGNDIAFTKEGEMLAKRERDAVLNMIDRDVQGLVLNSLQSDAELSVMLEQLRTPSILFQRNLRGLRWDNFISNDRQGTRDAMEHLIDLGHRRIALIKGFSFPSTSAHLRERAWKDALIAHNIEIDKNLVRDGHYSQAGAYGETKTLLTGPKPPTAILYYSDIMAIAGMRAAADLGIAVPEELSIVGYDNIDLDLYTIPRLSSINQVSGDMGRDMAKRLLERIQKPSLKAEIFTYPQKLILNESTGPAKL